MHIKKEYSLGGWRSLTLLLLVFANCVSAGTFGLFDYTDNGSYITITRYPTTEAAKATIPSSINSKPVTTIGYGAFDSCSSLTSVTIPSSVTTIQDSAFFNCYSLKVTIPSSVTSIGSTAFFGCTNLTSITIPSSVNSLGSYLFLSCHSLSAITVSSSNTVYSSSNGVLFNKNQTSLIRYPAGKTGSYVIPGTVTTIGSGAFDGCGGLTGVTIPSSVTSIGSGAFKNCGNLNSLSVPSSVTSIGSGAFSGCGSLAAIIVDGLNPGYSSADGVLFNKNQTTLIQCPGGKAGSYEIPSGITTIGDSTFSSCRNLTSVTMPSGVASISSNAFSGCDSLTSITIPSSVTSIGSNAFSGCRNLAGVTIPAGVTIIGTGAFDGCSSLTSITIPSSLTNMGERAFAGCSSLASVTVPSGVTSISSYAFFGCGNLTSVSIPSSVTSIGSSAFPGGSSLMVIAVDSLNPAYSSVDGVLFNKSQTLLIKYPAGKSGSYAIPSGVTTIGDSAFSYCRGLTSVTIPSDVTTIGGGAFAGCSGLTSVVIPGGVMSLGSSAFSGCSDLGSINIPASVTNIPSSAFSDCISLTTVIIPSNVTSIGSRAFSGCSGLTDVFIPTSVISIGDSALSRCGNLTTITVDSLNTAYSSAGGVLFNKNQTVLIRCPGGKSGNYVIPSSVTSIASGAFISCGNLTEVAIPSSVTSIGSDAFTGCGNLTAFTVDPLNSVYSGSQGILLNKNQTTLIRFPGGKAGTCIIPSSVTSIQYGAFQGCGNLTGITFSSSVQSIGSYAFSTCGSLTSVFIPSGVTSIGEGAFSNCCSLTAITVDPLNLYYSSLDGILYNKSQNILIQCPGGKSGSVIIPATVASLANSAFYGCPGLTGLCFIGNSPLEIYYSFSVEVAVYHFNGAVGFALPHWSGRTVTNMGSSSPVKPWLIANGYSYDTDWLSDPNGDGINLLMAYALNLDPRQNLCGSMPIPTIAGGQLSITYYARSPGIIYAVEASQDLKTWNQAGVTVSALNPNGYRTASSSVGGSSRYLRLVVGH